MSSGEAEFLIEIWDAVRDFVPANKRVDVAEMIVKSFADYGFEGKDIAEIVDEDRDLAEAYENIYCDEEDELDE